METVSRSSNVVSYVNIAYITHQAPRPRQNPAGTTLHVCSQVEHHTPGPEGCWPSRTSVKCSGAYALYQAVGQP
jgi:hypothetical protein